VCTAVKYRHDGALVFVHFAKPGAVLPVLLRSGEVRYVPWGRRQGESGRLPLSGWARLDSVRKGTWDKYSPVPVRIPVQQFMERDWEGAARWYNVGEDFALQGVLAGCGDEVRVYVIAVRPSTTALRQMHQRWPRIVKSDARTERSRQGAPVQLTLG
jgi:hypothetical protein